MLVPVENAHVVGAGTVGGIGYLTRQARMLDVVDQYDHVLAGSDVRPEMDREPGQSTGPLLVDRSWERHGRGIIFSG